MSKELIERLRSEWRKPENKPPEMLEAADRIEQLEAENAALKADVSEHKRLARELDVILNGEDGAAKQASLCDIVAQVNRSKSLVDAASQAREQQLRVALSQQRFWVEGALLCKEWEWDRDQRECAEGCLGYAREVLDLPQDTTALEAMIEKAGDVVVTKARQACIDLGAKGIDYFNYTSFVEAIDNLPTITIDDLK